ncbi:unnamed protein product [Mytilus edulis]|uniref:C-type lectin domain-containing protein n=1 Tax=Mytilus edulis TaxID=6550 RepID=A0A8S3QP97_MYTED|nr:unnamed protein product [Mytilus edulis]
MCAKLVLNRSKYDSAKQALFDLHWLPIKARITFKILTYMYNCHVGNAPSYLINLLNPQVSKRSLRSSESSIGCYAVPYNKKKTFSDRSFSTIGPKLWNELGTNKQCKDMRGYLVQITDSAENSWMVDMLTKSSAKFYYGFWMGMTDLKTEGEWRWANDESKFGFLTGVQINQTITTIMKIVVSFGHTIILNGMMLRAT